MAIDEPVASRPAISENDAAGVTEPVRAIRILLLSWHAEEGAIGAGGHRRTLKLVERFGRWGLLTIVDNRPSMFEGGLPGTTVVGYRLPALRRVAAVDRRLARVVQWPWAAVSLVWHGLRLHRKQAIDAIYVPNSEILPCLVAGVVLRRVLGRPLVLSNMNTGGVLFLPLVVALHNMAERVITLSPGLADALADRGLRRRPDVIGCGSPVVEQPDRDIGTEKQWDAIFIGRHTKSKGALDLLDIWETMRAQRPLGRLAMVGSCSTEMARLIGARCEAAPLLGGSVVRLGVLGEREKNQVLAGARILLFPSQAEGWGFVPLEALCRGVPVVCWDLPPYRTSLPDHPAVIRVPLGDHERFAAHALELLAVQDMALADLALGAPVDMPSWDDIATQEWAVLSSQASRHR